MDRTGVPVLAGLRRVFLTGPTFRW